MISFTVRMKFKSEDRASIYEALRALTEASRQEPGCVTYVTHAVEAEPDTIVIYEQYRGEAGLEAHRATPHFQKYAVGVLYQRMLERVAEDLIALA
ncbi:MAG: putative quinol monooxygenase [Silvibacterium sp.]